MNYQELKQKIKSRDIVLSFSSLKQFAKSPEHFVRYKTEPKAETPAMIFGSLVDMFVFGQDDLFNDKFVIGTVIPGTDNQKGFCNFIIDSAKLNGGVVTDDVIDSAFMNNYKKGNAQELYITLKPYIDAVISGKQIVSQQDVDHAKRMKDKLYSNKAGGSLMNQITSVQRKLEWEYLGWKFIGYADGDGDEILMDLKTTDADPDKVKRFVYQNKTYMQLGMYYFAFGLMGINIKKFKIVALDSGMNVSINDIDLDYVLYGVQEFKTLVHKFTKCALLNRFEYNYDFHGKFNGEYHLMKPTWAEDLMPIIDED